MTGWRADGPTSRVVDSIARGAEFIMDVPYARPEMGSPVGAYVTGLVNQELLLQNEYLVAENRILRAHLPARVRLSDPERSTLAEIGKRLGRQRFSRSPVSPNPIPSSPGIAV